jgi:uncharacterized protein (TIGR02271 family)
MAATKQKTIAAAFTNRDDAQRATRALRDAGFNEDQIGVASSRGRTDGDDLTDADEESYAAEGAVAGVATGAGLGALWGLGILAGILPAIGPAIAGGTLAVLLSSAAAGAAAAGLAGALIGMGMSKEEAEYYEGEMKAGRTIVTVNAGARQDEALRILRQFGGYSMGERTGASETRTTASSTAASTTHAGRGDTIQAREEQLRVSKTPVEKGEVKVRKEVHTEHKTVDVPVTREEVVIERHPVSGQAVSAGDIGAGQEIRIPVREEEVNIEKQAVVKEEVSVGKRRVTDKERVDETLRKEEIKIDTEGDVNVRDQRRNPR